MFRPRLHSTALALHAALGDPRNRYADAKLLGTAALLGFVLSSVPHADVRRRRALLPHRRRRRPRRRRRGRCIVEGTWAVVDAGWMPNCNEQKGAGVSIYAGGGEYVCIVDLSLDDPVESDAATGSVPRALLVLLLPGLLALGLL